MFTQKLSMRRLILLFVSVALLHTPTLESFYKSNETWWQPGQTIDVYFMNSTPRLRKVVAHYANRFSHYANLNFRFHEGPKTDNRRAILVSFGTDLKPGSGGWSYVGKGTTSTTHPSMKFRVSEVYWGGYNANRIIMHEFGHALGLWHEQQSPAGKTHWHKDRGYQYFKKNFGWDKQKSDQWIYNLYEHKDYSWSDFDLNSIMGYAVSEWYFKTGYSFGGKYTLSETDKQEIAKMYPGRKPPSNDKQYLTLLNLYPDGPYTLKVSHSDSKIWLYVNDKEIYKARAGGNTVSKNISIDSYMTKSRNKIRYYIRPNNKNFNHKIALQVADWKSFWWYNCETQSDCGIEREAMKDIDNSFFIEHTTAEDGVVETERILARYSNGWWYIGDLEKKGQKTATVKWLDGTTFNAPLEDLKRFDWSIGSRIQCKYKKDNHYYWGTINSWDGWDNLTIKWQDGGNTQVTGYDVCRSPDDYSGDQTELGKLKKNDKILALYSNNYWYAATYLGASGDLTEIRWMDDSTGYVAPSQVKPFQWKTGQPVECRWKKDNLYYKGTIHSLNAAANKMVIKWDDGGNTQEAGFDICRQPNEIASTGRFKQGKLVSAMWSNGYWYPATILYSTDKEAKIRWFDSTTQVLAADKVKTFHWKLNHPVQCRWSKDNAYYAGKVNSIDTDNFTVTIKWDDGGNTEVRPFSKCKSAN